MYEVVEKEAIMRFSESAEESFRTMACACARAHTARKRTHTHTQAHAHAQARITGA